jgi:hypothetical protein
MDPEAAAMITPNLLVGETILWCGRPHDTSALRGRALAIGVVGISALAMRAVPLDAALADQAAINSLLLAILFGCLLVEAMVFHSHLARTFYAVTNQRIVIVSGIVGPEVFGVLLDRLNTPQLKLHRFAGSIELRAPSDKPHAIRLPIPFTNPSVPPDWIDHAECYRLLGLENSSLVRDTILEAARRLN